MADQPNISQILAALANRPGSSAGQGQRPVQPSGYPPHQVTATQQAPFNSFQPPPHSYPPVGPVPGPAHSGGIDLSNIRPVNSGVVDLSDLRGRNPFSDRKSSYGDSQRNNGDYRNNGASYGPSRSRSRSPHRYGRDAPRDNYNSYRDDRRGDSRFGNSYPGRDRSFSPDRSNRAALYPPQPAQSYGGRNDNILPSRQVDENSEIISINSSLVGLIIGRQGENLRRVETETKARVQFVTPPDTGVLERECRITGTRIARDLAKGEIARIIQESGKSLGSLPGPGPAPVDVEPHSAARNTNSHQTGTRISDDTTQMMVPNRTVGLIIGKGGETIRDLQLRSGCHVNILGEDKTVNGLRPVNLIGDQQSAARARELIMQIVESDANGTASVASGGRPDGKGFGPSETDRIFVPSEAVGMIIGKGGETVKEMQNGTGCKINVTPASGRDIEREIGLIGTRNAIESAKTAIWDKVRSVQEKNRPSGQFQPSGAAPAQQQQFPGQQVDQASGGNPDPYAEYGGYQNYLALWYSSLQANQGQQETQAKGPTGM